MDKERKKPGPAPTGKTPIRSMRVSDAEWAEWQAAAELAGLSVTVWARGHLNRLAKRAPSSRSRHKG